jgi:hypothetical protein
MALTNYAEIKERVLAELERLKATSYPEDILTELADSEVPIYYSEIIDEWREMPSEYCDNWHGFGYESDRITNLMAYDLATYYQERFDLAWTEIKEELEEEA